MCSTEMTLAVTVRMLDLRCRGWGLDSWPGRDETVTIWMGDVSGQVNHLSI